jgi:hypothetical protein
MIALLSLVLLPCQAPALGKLTNEELIREYEAAGTELERYFPEDRHGESRFPPLPRLNSARGEIVHRGRAVAPELIRFLEQEAPKTRPESKHGARLSFTSDTLSMLVRIGDERAAPVMLRILSGFDGKVDLDERHAALDALRSLTHASFTIIVPSTGYCRDAVEAPEALRSDGWSDLDQQAGLYRQWFEGEGRDAAQWLAIARSRARAQLAGKDIRQIYCAAAFLCTSPANDDDPGATLAVLMPVIDKLKRAPNGEPYEYDYEGVRAPMPIGNFVQLAANSGPRARPYSSTFIRYQREVGDLEWEGYVPLRAVGGTEILAHLFALLPSIGAEAEKLEADPQRPTRFDPGDPRMKPLMARRAIQDAIDRWAGRLFESDAERVAWWEANKTQTGEQLLRPNLALLMKQADEGATRQVPFLARQVLPELPEQGEGHFRQAWLEKHRAALVYDENAGVFRLK